MEPQITYIIPYYNGQATIRRQLDSIYATSLGPTELEVIIIDDASPSSAPNTLHHELSKYPGLRIIRHETNRRQGGAKNTGIHAAKGEFIAFADQDDTIDPTHIKEILTLAITQQPDVILCQARRYHINGKLQTPGHPLGNGATMSGKQFCEKYFNAAFSASPWSNIYRREYLIELHRPMAEKTLLEDVDWVQYHLFFAKKLMNFNYPIYNWYAQLV